jgi:hypothetical protein
MTANTRNFEAELQAQHDEAARRTAEVSAEAEVVAATAL